VLAKPRAAGAHRLPALAWQRCFSLHRDRHLKPKFISIMALRAAAQRQQHPTKPYACYLIHFNKTADAASFMKVMKYVCHQKLQEASDGKVERSAN